MDQNGRPFSVGTGGRFESEPVADFSGISKLTSFQATAGRLPVKGGSAFLMNQEIQKHDNSDEIRRYRERYVAFIDILGFSRHVEKSIKDRALFSTLRSILSSGALTANHKRPDDVRSYHFSDSIVISTIYDPEGLKEIIESVQLTCISLLCYRILTRGGITKGKLYDDGKSVFGPALIRAYHIEKDIALYPRILMDRCIYREVNKSSYSKNAFRKDFDDLYHLDLLKHGQFCEGDPDIDIGHNKPPIMAWTTEEWLQKIKKFIEEELVQQKDKTAVVKKYVWMAKYFNSFLRKSSGFHISAIKSRLLRELL
ncbi:MAG: hypothetical protein KJ800_04325 [Proteobacteria bacterium]|nr:hypothetical protein [Pseudomonadota bacterium]